jgi:AcrR family transcriptional regulator
VSEPTARDRLITAALTLFAENGYARTTVGEIEAAAGFTPRGGTLYKHFAGKDELLQAALDRHARDVTRSRPIVDLLPLDDLHAETVLVMRYLLRELASHRELQALIEKEGAHYPFLAQRFWDEIAEPGYRLSASILDRQLNTDGNHVWDAEALAVVLVGTIVNYRRGQWTFGTIPLDVDEERLVQTLAQLVQSAADPLTSLNTSAPEPSASHPRQSAAGPAN